MLSKKAGAEGTATTAPNNGNIDLINDTTKHATLSSKNLKEQLGLLLCHFMHAESKKSEQGVSE